MGQRHKEKEGPYLLLKITSKSIANRTHIQPYRVGKDRFFDVVTATDFFFFFFFFFLPHNTPRAIKKKNQEFGIKLI